MVTIGCDFGYVKENLLLAELNKPIQREDEKLDVEGIKLTAAERALLAVLYSTPKEHLPMERLCKLIYDTEETANNRKNDQTADKIK